MRDFKELAVELRQAARAEVALVAQFVALEVVGALAQHFAGVDVVLHNGGGAVLLYRADLHADAAAFVARHNGAAAVVDELVLFGAAPPDLFLDQRAAGAAVHADLADLAELVQPVVHRLIVGYGGVGGNHREAGPGAEVRRQQLPVCAQLTESGGDEHRDIDAAVVVGAVNLGVVAEAANVVGEVERQCAFDFVCAEVREFGFQAGDRLRLVVVLLQRQADGMLILDPALLAGVGVLVVELGEAHFAEAQFARLEADDGCHILAHFGRGGGRQVAGYERGVHKRLVDLVVALAVLQHLFGIDGPDPISVCRLLDVLGLYGIDAAVERDVLDALRDARHGRQVIRNGYLYIRLSVEPPRPVNYVAYGLPRRFFEHRLYLPPRRFLQCEC